MSLQANNRFLPLPLFHLSFSILKYFQKLSMLILEGLAAGGNPHLVTLGAYTGKWKIFSPFHASKFKPSLPNQSPGGSTACLAKVLLRIVWYETKSRRLGK
ncbi:hypothetical protein CLOLEP_00895 [[Clostridium] leptum DSM 753]|uniref:Uncharacterized protein n=1 Tax=[Clostridium] leptum DSM 753 TaxID=428125 RepID=A7VQR4_9FIRM|nr:hypothetical protein CLOLEP_00895 [[Clostridium] leptum DSM 753]